MYNWPLRVFYTLLRCWCRLWRLARYVYNWSLRVFYTLLSLSRRLWHLTITCMLDLHDYLDHFVFLTSFRVLDPFWVRYSVCCVYTITSVCLTFWSYIPFWVYISFWPLWQPIGVLRFNLMSINITTILVCRSTHQTPLLQISECNSFNLILFTSRGWKPSIVHVFNSRLTFSMFVFCFCLFVCLFFFKFYSFMILTLYACIT